MKVFLAIIAAAGLGYFLGSLNFSIIVVRMMTGRDIRDMGSKNAGLTNTLRCAGKSCALFTLLGDLLKGIIAVALARDLCRAMILITSDISLAFLLFSDTLCRYTTVSKAEKACL